VNLGNVNGYIEEMMNGQKVVKVFVMAMAGAERIFKLMDEKVETDDGYVTLVNVLEEDGTWKESETRTGRWELYTGNAISA